MAFMIYISLIGNQAMAVINPLLALAERFGSPKIIHLLKTRSLDLVFDEGMGFLRKRFGADIIHYHDISETLKWDGSLPPAQALVGKLTAGQDEPLFFNLGGGMNFQLSACVLELGDRPCTFTYPDDECIHLYAFGADGFSHKTLPLPSPVDVMKIQGLACRSGGSDTPNVKLLLEAAEAKNLKKLLKNCLFNVEFGGSHSIWPGTAAIR
jgi:hypothetical protein